MDDDRLEAYLALLTPFADLHRAYRYDIRVWKSMYPNPDPQLRAVLARLNVPQLEDYLVWVPAVDDLEQIGQGGFANVYRGSVVLKEEAASRTSELALKELNTSMVPELVLNIVLGYVGEYPNSAIMPPIGLSQHPDTKRLLMVTSYARNGTLEHRIPLITTSNWHDIAATGATLASRLSTLHRFGFSHNDLHPRNIVFSGTEPYLVDAGLSKSVEDAHASPGVYGRLDYLPPEAFDRRPQTQSSDVYCFGTLLWQSVVGVPPRGIAPVAIRTRSKGMREDMIPGAPQWFTDVITDCWNKNPEKRPKMDMVYHHIEYSLAVMLGGSDDIDGARLESGFAPETIAFVEERRETHRQEVEEGEGSLYSVEEDGAVSGLVSFHTSQFHTEENLRGIAEAISRAIGGEKGSETVL